MATFSQRFELIVTTVVASAAIVVAAMLVRREFQPAPEAPKSGTQILEAGEWAALRTSSRRFGATGALVTLVEFGDFECPACRSFATTTLTALLDAYPADLEVIYRHRPLAQHRFARQAALAADCSNATGHFHAFHDLLYQKQDSLGLLPWGSLASRVGVTDTVAFRQCMVGPAGAGYLTDSVLAMQFQVDAVPTVIVNGVRFDGPPSYKQVSQFVDSVLRSR